MEEKACHYNNETIIVDYKEQQCRLNCGGEAGGSTALSDACSLPS